MQASLAGRNKEMVWHPCLVRAAQGYYCHDCKYCVVTEATSPFWGIAKSAALHAKGMGHRLTPVRLEESYRD